MADQPEVARLGEPQSDLGGGGEINAEIPIKSERSVRLSAGRPGAHRLVRAAPGSVGRDSVRSGCSSMVEDYRPGVNGLASGTPRLRPVSGSKRPVRFAPRPSPDDRRPRRFDKGKSPGRGCRIVPRPGIRVEGSAGGIANAGGEEIPSPRSSPIFRTIALLDGLAVRYNLPLPTVVHRPGRFSDRIPRNGPGDP